MDNQVTDNQTTNEESFEALFLASVSDEKQYKVGEIFTGTVIKVGKDYATVDIGYKSEGLIPLSEFKDADGKANVAEGDSFDVFLESIENEDGLIILSKEKADKLKIWDEIAEACENQEVIEGRVIDRVKGGLSVDIGVKAFLPGSQVDLVPLRNLDAFVGNTYQFKIIKFNKLRGNIVLSRRAILEAERSELREKTLEVLEEGCIAEGIVKNITDYGAFIDLGGIDGLLHITDISWKRINNPSEVLNLSDKVQVKVLKYDKDKQRVSLGMKQITEDPWKDADLRYPKNAKVEGHVVNLTDYGAFIEIEDGVEGLIHVSEMSWTKRVKHPSAILNLGDKVESVVLEMDKENRRMSLGLKQTQPNPWDILVEKYPEGTKVKGVVRNVTDFGLFIEVEKDIDGLVHISDLSWSSKPKNPHNEFKKGDEVDAIVLNVDPSAEKFSLGIKQLTTDPWKEIASNYKIGAKVEGEIVKITEFGIFLKVAEDVEGLIHNSEVDVDKVEDKYKEGDHIEATLLTIDANDRKLSLSLKEMTNEQREQLAKKQAAQASPTLGDLMGKFKGTEESQ
ncbi:MAG: 30S ribosomal protein S1 [Deltaproteobacteria bacterium]|nr:30S ribosomal protein S1 [Deltaproteobacteria bacterium]